MLEFFSKHGIYIYCTAINTWYVQERFDNPAQNKIYGEFLRKKEAIKKVFEIMEKRLEEK